MPKPVRAWMDEEERILIERYVVEGPEAVADELGRSRYDVSRRARLLGIGPSVRRCDPRRGESHDGFAATYDEVARELGLCRKSVKELETKALRKLAAALAEVGIDETDADHWSRHARL